MIKMPTLIDCHFQDWVMFENETKQVLLPDVLTRVTIGKIAAGLISNYNCANISQTFYTECRMF